MAKITIVSEWRGFPPEQVRNGGVVAPPWGGQFNPTPFPLQIRPDSESDICTLNLKGKIAKQYRWRLAYKILYNE